MGGLLHERESAPGETFTGAIEIANPSSTPQRVRISSADLVVEATGVQFGPVGSHKRSNAGWLALEADDFVVSAGETSSIR